MGTETTTAEFEFTPVPYKGWQWKVHHAGRPIGTVSNRPEFIGYIAHKRGADKAVLGDDGFAAEFPTKQDAARALLS